MTAEAKISSPRSAASSGELVMVGGDAPDRAAAYVELGFVTLRQGAPDHEARGDLGFVRVQPGEEIADQLRHLQPTLSLGERLADCGEIVK